MTDEQVKLAAKVCRMYLGWVGAGCPDNDEMTDDNPAGFHTAYGLCHGAGNLDGGEGDHYDALREAFISEGLDTCFPFGCDAFMRIDDISRDPNRIAFCERWTARG